MQRDLPPFAVPAELDKVTVSIDRLRAIPGTPTDITISGHSQKRLHPLWTWSHREDDSRNIEHVVSGILGAVLYYLPTSPEKFLRACVGGETVGPDDHGMEPML